MSTCRASVFAFLSLLAICLVCGGLLSGCGNKSSTSSASSASGASGSSGAITHKGNRAGTTK